MKKPVRSRVQSEIDRWRMSWQEVETFIDRVEGSRDEDEPYRVRSLALHDAAIVLERLRLRREGAWMPHPRRMQEHGSAQISNSAADRKYELPGPVDVELAVAGLELDQEDGTPITDPPKVRLFGSEYLFDMWDEERGQFVEMVVPEYAFGRLAYPAPVQPHPFLPGLNLAMVVTAELGDADDSDDSLFSFPRREAAAEEGVVELKKWSALRAERLQAITNDGVADTLVVGQPEFATLRQLVEQGDFAQARSLTTQALQWATVDVTRLAGARSSLEQLDPEDEALAPLASLGGLVAAEVSQLATLSDELSKSVTASRKAAALALVDGLPTSLSAMPLAALLYAELDISVAERIAYPDGALRSLRMLEVAMARMWRGRKVWFAQRASLLSRLMSRFLAPFERNLTGLVQTGTTQLSDALMGARVGVATAAGADQLSLQVSSAALAGVRAGEIAVVGGSRPALAILLGPSSPTPAHQRVRCLPLRVSQARGIGLDGIPGLVSEGSTLARTLSRPLTGAEYQRGARAGEPEADAIPQDVVALWSRLKLVRGSAFALALPAPFDAGLELPVHVTPDAVVAAHAPSVLLPTAPIEGRDSAAISLVGSPGEVLLLRGRDVNGQWWQGVVAVAASQVTTMEAQNVAPVSDPSSPICCQSETPVVLLTLAENTMPVDLVAHVTVHRRFEGFGWPTVAVGKLLPAVVDPNTKQIAVEDSGEGYRFVVGGSGPLVDRGPELEAASRLFERWTGGR